MAWLIGIIVLLAMGTMACFTVYFASRSRSAEAEAREALRLEYETRERLSPLKKYLPIRDVEQAQRSLIDEAKRVQDTIRTRTQQIQAQGRQIEEYVSALRNKIDGYGDRYLEPNESSLDGLAEDFSHKQAGSRLKECRKFSRQLVKEGYAFHVVENSNADFDAASLGKYVLICFNAEVDAIAKRLSRFDFGTARRRVRDAALIARFSEVFYASSQNEFRVEVEVSSAYLAARIDEIKWAYAVMTLRDEERAEQARIREQIRDEQRAEKELRELEAKERRERELVERTRLEIEARLASASNEEIEGLQAQLDAAKEEMRLLEEQQSRTQARAELTRRGHVYVVSNIGSFGPGIYKVGLTRRLDPEERVKELGDASVPFYFDVHAIVASDDSPRLESELHKALGEFRVNKANRRKEFFRVGLDTIRSVIEAHGGDVVWTRFHERAEALEYRETLAIEARARGDEVPEDVLGR